MSKSKQRLVRGNGRAVTVYIERNSSELGKMFRGVARKRIRDEAIIDDLVQETFMRSLRSADTFLVDATGDFKRRVRSWLFKVFWSVYYNHLRRSRLRPKTLEGREDEFSSSYVDHSSSDPLGVMQRVLVGERAEELDDRLNSSLQAINPNYRDAFVLVVLGGLSYEDVARRLGVNVGTVMSRVHRAKKRLRVRLSAV